MALLLVKGLLVEGTRDKMNRSHKRLKDIFITSFDQWLPAKRFCLLVDRKLLSLITF